MKRFSEDVTLTSLRDPQNPHQIVGSRIQHGARVYELPQYPKRIKDVVPNADGSVAVHFEHGHARILDPRHDAALVEASSAGGSAGGHDPKAHGKIRYIVRAFGKWARGQHSVCVRRIRTEHPEVAKGRNINALCAWLKDQWAGTTKWRGRKSDPKQRAEGKAIMRKASATAYARFSHGMPPLPPDALDNLVEDVQKLTGISPRDIVLELRGEIDDLRGENDAIFDALWEAEVELSADALVEVELGLVQAVRQRQAGVCEALVESWLGLHGKAVECDGPQTALDAAEQIVGRRGGAHGSELEQAVTEALLYELIEEPVIEEDAFEEADVKQGEERRVACTRCTASQLITRESCSRCGHSLTEARKAALDPPREGQLVEQGALTGIEDPPAAPMRSYESMVEEAVRLSGLPSGRFRGLSPRVLAEGLEDLRAQAPRKRPPEPTPADGRRLRLHSVEQAKEHIERSDAGEWQVALRHVQEDLGYTMRDEPGPEAVVRLTHAHLPTLLVEFSDDRGGIHPWMVVVEQDEPVEQANDYVLECARCGHENSEDAAKCAKCGASLSETQTEAVLTARSRKGLSSSSFALPGRRYPIHDKAHARNALARVAQHGSPEEKKRVRAAVKRRYPGMVSESAVELEERTIAPVKPHLRVMGDGRIVAVSRHERGVGGNRDEIRTRSEAVSKGNRTRAELRREAEHEKPDSDDVATQATEAALAAAAEVMAGGGRL